MRITASCLILFTFLNTSSKAAEFTRESPSTIHMAGAISDGDLQKIEKIYSPATTLIRVKSGGGNTEAGMLLGRFIREKNLDIQVDEICASSCANYLFPAARRKIIPTGAILALHGTAYTTSLADDKRMREMLLDAGLPSSGIETEVEDLRLALAKQARLERQFSTDLKIAAAYYSDFKAVVEKSQSIIAKFNNKDASLFWWPSTKRLTSCYGIDNVEDFGRPPGIGSDGYSYAAKFSALITGDDNLPDCR